MIRKTLGRCSRRHAQVVEYEDATLPVGVCRYVDVKRPGSEPCGEPLIEWALRTGAPKESR